MYYNVVLSNNDVGIYYIYLLSAKFLIYNKIVLKKILTKNLYYVSIYFRQSKNSKFQINLVKKNINKLVLLKNYH